MTLARGPLRKVRQYLDEMMYSLVDLRMSFEAPPSPTGFPRFQQLREIVQRLDPAHEVLFRLFRLGEAVDSSSVAGAIPEQILEAMAAAGILAQISDSAWQTPSLLIIPAEGMLLMVGIPPSYPTATKPCNPWFDLSSHVVARALPGWLEDQRVLDICSGSGLQTLLCATRGASRALGLELSGEAVSTAQANAIFNHLDDKVEFRQSDKLAGLKNGETFDFVVCNSPYAPVISGSQAPSGLGEIGNSVLLKVLPELLAHLSANSHGILGSWRAIGRQASTYQMEVLASQLEDTGCSTFTFVDLAPDTPEGVLKILQNDLEQRGETNTVEITSKVRTLLQGSVGQMDGFYNQLIYFRKGKMESTRKQRATCGLATPVQVGAAR